MNNTISQISSSMNQFSPTDKINDLYKIINNNYDLSSSSIYNEILNREKDMKDLIERVVEYKDKEKLSEQFTQKSIADVSNNLFKTLNKILEESTDDNNSVIFFISKISFSRTTKLNQINTYTSYS